MTDYERMLTQAARNATAHAWQLIFDPKASQVSTAMPQVIHIDKGATMPEVWADADEITALDLLRSVTAERDRARELAATLEEELARVEEGCRILAGEVCAAYDTEWGCHSGAYLRADINATDSLHYASTYMEMLDLVGVAHDIPEEEQPEPEEE